MSINNHQMICGKRGKNLSQPTTSPFTAVEVIFDKDLSPPAKLTSVAGERLIEQLISPSTLETSSELTPVAKASR